MDLLESSWHYKQLTPELKAQICNGAGAAGQWISSFIPNTMYGLDVEEVFNIHDFDYHVGLTLEDKNNADRRMLRNMFAVINAEKGFFGKSLGFLRRRRALKYYEAVHLHGGEAFFKGKNG